MKTPTRFNKNPIEIKDYKTSMVTQIIFMFSMGTIIVFPLAALGARGSQEHFSGIMYVAIPILALMSVVIAFSDHKKFIKANREETEKNRETYKEWVQLPESERVARIEETQVKFFKKSPDGSTNSNFQPSIGRGILAD